MVFVGLTTRGVKWADPTQPERPDYINGPAQPTYNWTVDSRSRSGPTHQVIIRARLHVDHFLLKFLNS